MTDVRRAVINAAVAHVHNKTRGVELRLREPFAGEPREIARTAREIAGQVAGHDLAPAFVAALVPEGRMDTTSGRVASSAIFPARCGR